MRCTTSPQCGACRSGSRREPDAWRDDDPDFRHLLEAHHLAGNVFQDVVMLLTKQGLILREGTIVDATLIAAPPSTKNGERKRDPDMSSSKKGNQWHFGVKAHFGVDTAHGLVHTMQATTGKVSDYGMSNVLLHGDDATAHGDRGYADKAASPVAPAASTTWAHAGLFRSSARKAAI